MKRVEQTKTTVYIIDEENKTVKATIKNTKYDAINSIVKSFSVKWAVADAIYRRRGKSGHLTAG